MEVLRRHLAQTAIMDPVALAADYAPDALLRTHEGEVRGNEAIAAWFAARRDSFLSLTLRLERLEARPRFAAVEWWAQAGTRFIEGRDEFDLDDRSLIVEQRIVRVSGTRRRFRDVRVEVEPPLMRIILDREEKRNAVSLPMLAIMTQAVHEAAANDTIGALVLRGEGSGFCAGEDVDGFDFPDLCTASSFLDGPLGFFTALESIPKPVVAAVHGHAFGFGSEVLLACDSCFATPKARFGFLEIDHGALPSVLLTRGLDTVFRRRALDLALTGRVFTALEAVSARLVHRVVDDARDAAESAAVSMSQWPGAAVALIKGLLGAGAADDHDRARQFMPGVLLQVEPSL